MFLVFASGEFCPILSSIMLYCSFLRDECIIACIAWITDNKIILIAQGLKCSGHVLRVHDGPVTGLSLHATGDYVLTTSIDQHWTFSDINTGRSVANSKHDFFPKKHYDKRVGARIISQKVKTMNNSILIVKHSVMCAYF